MTPEQAKSNFKPTRKYRFKVPAGVTVGSPNWRTLAKADLDAKFDSLGGNLQTTIDQYQTAGMIEGAVNKMPEQPVQIDAPIQPATPLPATQAVQKVVAPKVAESVPPAAGAITTEQMFPNPANVATPSPASNQAQGYGESQY